MVAVKKGRGNLNDRIGLDPGERERLGDNRESAERNRREEAIRHGEYDNAREIDEHNRTS